MSKKSYLISALALIAGIILGCIVSSESHKPTEKTIEKTTPEVTIPDKSYTIIMKPIIVYEYSGYYVTESSQRFVIGRSVKGYRILVRDNQGTIISDIICPAARIDYYMELTRFKISE